MFDFMYDESVLTLLLCFQKWVSADGEERKSDSKVKFCRSPLSLARVCALTLSRARAVSLAIARCLSWCFRVVLVRVQVIMHRHIHMHVT